MPRREKYYLVLIYLCLVGWLQVLPVTSWAKEPMPQEKKAVFSSEKPSPEKSGQAAKVAILPFENMSGCFLAIDEMMKPFYRALGTVYCLSSYEDVDDIILHLRLRHTGFLTSQAASEIGQRLGVEAIILGMICVYQEAPEPKIGLIMKMIGTGEGTPILWMKSAFTSGSFSGSWFGRNRITKTGPLIDGIIKDLVAEMPKDLIKRK